MYLSLRNVLSVKIKWNTIYYVLYIYTSGDLLNVKNKKNNNNIFLKFFLHYFKSLKKLYYFFLSLYFFHIFTSLMTTNIFNFLFLRRIIVGVIQYRNIEFWMSRLWVTRIYSLDRYSNPVIFWYTTHFDLTLNYNFLIGLSYLTVVQIPYLPKGLLPRFPYIK